MLLVVLPFTKLFHAFTVFVSRWYNGANQRPQRGASHERLTLDRGSTSSRVIDAPIASLLLQLRALRPVRRGLSVLHRNRRPEVHAHPQAGAAAPHLEQEYTLLGKLGEDGRPVQAGHRRRARGVEGAGLRQLHAVRALLAWSARSATTSPTWCARCAKAWRPPATRRKALVGAATTRAIKIGSPMGVKWPAVQAQMKHVEAEPASRFRSTRGRGIHGAAVVDGDHQLPRIPGRDGQDLQAGRQDLDAVLGGLRGDQRRHPDRRLGHRARARRRASWTGPSGSRSRPSSVRSAATPTPPSRWDGAEPDRPAVHVQVLHILEVLEELRAGGCSRPKARMTERLTFHDPCQMARRGGVVEQPRNLLNMVAKDFVEMPDAGMHNWCCGGGGGASAIEEAEHCASRPSRSRSGSWRRPAPRLLVTACANCRIVIEEGWSITR